MKHNKTQPSENRTAPQRPVPAQPLGGEREPVLTDSQRQLYRVLLETCAPMSAYQLIDTLGQTLGKRIYPQTVYRNLATLQALGLVHKLESINSFAACVKPSEPHQGIHLLCDVCGNAEEVMDARIGQLLSQDAARQRFDIEHQIVELHGVCSGCRKTSTGGDLDAA